MCDTNDIEWLNCVLENRGGFSICRRKMTTGPRPYTFECKYVVTDTVRKRLDRIKKILGGGQITKVYNENFKKGFAWTYHGNTAQVRKLLEVCNIPDRHQQKAVICKEFMATVGKGLISDDQYAIREASYTKMKLLNKRAWCE